MDDTDGTAPELGQDWADAGDASLARGDDCLGVDDFEGACRCYLVAAWCYLHAARECGSDPASRRWYLDACNCALRAAEPLLTG